MGGQQVVLILFVERISTLLHSLLFAKVHKLAALEEVQTCRTGRVDVWKDAIEVNDSVIQTVGAVHGEEGFDVVGFLADPRGLEVPHANEGAVNLKHKVGDLVELRLLGWREAVHDCSSVRLRCCCLLRGLEPGKSGGIGERKLASGPAVGRQAYCHGLMLPIWCTLGKSRFGAEEEPQTTLRAQAFILTEQSEPPGKIMSLTLCTCSKRNDSRKRWQ